MATTIEKRVARLEGAPGAGVCPECGFDGDWSKVRTVFEDAGGNRPENCGTCGRALRIVLAWGEGA